MFDVIKIEFWYLFFEWMKCEAVRSQRKRVEAALREQRAIRKAVEQVESLILAQHERWRRA